MFHPPAEEPEIVADLAASLRPMTDQEFSYFFVAETDVLAGATVDQRAFIQEQYLTCELDAAPGGGAFSRTCPPACPA